MKSTGAVSKVLAVLCLLQVVTAWRKFNDLRIKTAAYGLKNSDAYFEIPTTSCSPLFRDFVKVEPEADFPFPMDFYCHQNDPRVCFMYDKKGNVAGVQLSFLKEDVSNVKKEHYDYESNINYVKTNFFNKPAYSSRVYFTNPEKLTNAGRGNTDETAEGLWAYLEGKLVEIQRKEPTGPKMGDFDRQGCYPAMGQHYFYKYNKDSDCSKLYALFPLYEQGGLVGFGMGVLGSGFKNHLRDWYEKPNHEVGKFVVTNPPPCDHIARTYGFTTVHVYLVDKPWDITCP
ncbi:unnamed protein product [Nezara viridula]|uniref:Uncharacterized protein n=1 Tax=Nezara viridula TaxID=85310 RepID=A0A9P0H7X6_NEZVI|nr:unnamed protein product [Nezara viridula]